MTRSLVLVLLLAAAVGACSSSATPAPGTPGQSATAVSSTVASAAPAPVASVDISSPVPSPASVPVTSPAPSAAGFATPEEAVKAYLAAVAAADAGGILRACAIEQEASGFRFDHFVDRLNAMMVTVSLAPADNQLFVDMNRVQLSSRILGQARMLVYSLLSTEKIDGSTISPADAARAQAFAAQVDPRRLAGMTVLQVRFSNARFEHNETYLANAAKSAQSYGADEMTERVALFSFEGKLYYVGFTLLRYGSAWAVSDQVANLANTSALGTATLLGSLSDFDSVTGGN